MSGGALGELEKYKIQLQQVEAALIAEPDNEDLLKLKDDLNEIIELQAQLVGNAGSSPNTPSPNQGQSNSVFTEKMQWKVGDRCLAPTKNGQRHVAVIDGISQDKVAITFASNGKKDMVKLVDLTIAPVEEKKKYIFQTGKAAGGGPKKEWQMERERRKLRAQKKEQRRKTLDEQKESEKNKWKNFNVKAEAKSMKGLKRVAASGSSADGGRAAPSRNNTIISSRRDYQSFGATLRGNMESLF